MHARPLTKNGTKPRSQHGKRSAVTKKRTSGKIKTAFFDKNFFMLAKILRSHQSAKAIVAFFKLFAVTEHIVDQDNHCIFVDITAMKPGCRDDFLFQFCVYQSWGEASHGLAFVSGCMSHTLRLEGLYTIDDREYYKLQIKPIGEIDNDING